MAISSNRQETLICTSHTFLSMPVNLNPIHRIFVIGFLKSPSPHLTTPLVIHSILHQFIKRRKYTTAVHHQPYSIPSLFPPTPILPQQAIPANHDTASQPTAVGGEITAIAQNSHTSLPRFHHRHHQRNATDTARSVHVNPVSGSLHTFGRMTRNGWKM